MSGELVIYLPGVLMLVIALGALLWVGRANATKAPRVARSGDGAILASLSHIVETLEEEARDLEASAASAKHERMAIARAISGARYGRPSRR
jgi:hypothetical protein